MVAKLILKFGDATIEYEGPEAFLKEELPQMVKALGDLRAIAPPMAHKNQPSLANDAASMSVTTIAQKLGVDSGPDLIMAAALSLALNGSPNFTKKQLRQRARDATTYWKGSYGNNFDNYVKTLVTNGRMNHAGGLNYALPDGERTSLEAKLGAS